MVVFAKAMLLRSKIYSFDVQNLCFCALKSMLLQAKRIGFAICFIFPCKNREYRRGNCEDFTKILFKPYSEVKVKLPQVVDSVLNT